MKNNLQLETDDIIQWCAQAILNENADTQRKGKNWYVGVDGVIITVNAHSYTVITAHKQKEK